MPILQIGMTNKRNMECRDGFAAGKGKMTHTIAVAGKGGVGKTTTCGMIVEYLAKGGKGPILVVDADANSNLNEVLGVEIETTLGDIREEMARAELMKESPIPHGMTKAEYAEMKFSSALIEEDDYDMLVMGRTQGAGCYCYVNGVLKSQIDFLKLMVFNTLILYPACSRSRPHSTSKLPLGSVTTILVG